MKFDMHGKCYLLEGLSIQEVECYIEDGWYIVGDYQYTLQHFEFLIASDRLFDTLEGAVNQVVKKGKDEISAQRRHLKKIIQNTEKSIENKQVVIEKAESLLTGDKNVE